MTSQAAEPQKADLPKVVHGGREIPVGPSREADLKWRRKKMVRWLSPGQLTATAVRALLSSIFGSYADRREVQAALHQADPAQADPDCAPTDGGIYRYDGLSDPAAGFWLDFVADLGDGFDATYTVAWLLGQPSLPIPLDAESLVPARADGVAGARTLRGQILIMGGDQVYPTASRNEYINRLAGPYEAALPWSPPPVPHLYAIPGNHDWYDGLTAFLRLFCQRRWIGAWRTQQNRSYFALQLPDRWWLLGLDAQLESDIDQPQREYFCRVAERMRPGDRVILCTAQPSWAHTGSDPTAFDNLAFFEKTVLAPSKVELVLTLTGDLHHYSRYSDEVRSDHSKHHKITAGGGGAYLLGTQILGEKLNLRAPLSKPEGQAAQLVVKEAREPYKREVTYPSAGNSMRLKWGVLRLGWKNPSFVVFLGLMYALFAWFLQSSSKLFMPLSTWPARAPYHDFMSFAAESRSDQWPKVLGAFWTATAHYPLLVAFALTILAGLIAFCKPDEERFQLLRKSHFLRTAVRVAVGSVHAAAHLTLAIGLIWFFSRVNLGVWHWDVDDPRQTVLFVVEMALVGGAIGSLLMSFFLLPFVNYNEAFSAQHLEGYKNFVRLHIAPGGALKLYAYGVDRASGWDFCAKAPPGKPYFVPQKVPGVRLIDQLTIDPPGRG